MFNTRRSRVITMLVLVMLIVGTIAWQPHQTFAAKKEPITTLACTGGTVVTLASNGYVYQNFNIFDGASGYLYTAPAGRGFRYCGTYYDGRYWVWGHSAVDSRDGYMLRCHIYGPC